MWLAAALCPADASDASGPASHPAAAAAPAGAKDYLIDLLALPRDDVRCLLAPVLSNPRICKVCCGDMPGEGAAVCCMRRWSL